MVHKRLEQINRALTNKQQNLINAIDNITSDIQKEVDAHRKGMGKDGTIGQLEQISIELDKMKSIMNINTFLPNYPRTIVDSWDFSSELGLRLLEIADEYKTVAK